MTIQEKLLPLIENTDYKIKEGELIPLPKIRQVEQTIHHEAIEEVIAVPEEGIEAVEAVEAYDEVVLTDETYYEVIPSMSEVKLSCIDDVVLAIEEYLADKAELRDPENDSINIVENRIHSWGFTNIPQPSVDELYDAYLAKVPKVEQEQINVEARAYLAATDWMVTRFAETQVEIPEEVRLLRQAARESIV